MARLFRKEGDLPKRSLWQRIKDVALTDVSTFVRGAEIAGSLEKLEEVLLEADFGVSTTMRLVGDVEHAARARLREDADRVPGAVAQRHRRRAPRRQQRPGARPGAPRGRRSSSSSA